MDYSDPEPEKSYPEISLQEILDELCDIACSRKIIEDSITYRDLFDTRLMNCILPRPAQVKDTFWEKYRKSPREATDFYYEFSQNSNYIRRERIARDLKWKVPSAYGEIDITINLSKPEKESHCGSGKSGIVRLSEMSSLRGK